MRRVLLPVEETERSLKALQYACKNYNPEKVEIVLMMVDENVGYTAKPEVEKAAIAALDEKMEVMKESLPGFKVITQSAIGKPGIKIVRTARELGVDAVVLTKSSKEEMIGNIGKTTEYIINNAPCQTVIVSEIKNTGREYRGLVYKTASGTVNLRGQLGNKQSECLLPSVKVDCLYHIEVTVGKVRFFHTSYNPDSRAWDLPPQRGQAATVDVSAGESQDILVKADSRDGRADRIRIVNRDMKKEAVFSYKILPAEMSDEMKAKLEAAEKPAEEPAEEPAESAPEFAPDMPEDFTPEMPEDDAVEELAGFGEVHTFEYGDEETVDVSEAAAEFTEEVTDDVSEFAEDIEDKYLDGDSGEAADEFAEAAGDAEDFAEDATEDFAEEVKEGAEEAAEEVKEDVSNAFDGFFAEVHED